MKHYLNFIWKIMQKLAQNISQLIMEIMHKMRLNNVYLTLIKEQKYAKLF